jgi:AraC-like DNA-binding protein
MVGPGQITQGLSLVELDALGVIRSLREATRDERATPAEFNPAAVIHDILANYHGHIGLRLRILSQELGTTMRVLERTFEASYGMSMRSYHRSVRIGYAEMLLQNDPTFKISAIAALLGYRRVSEFTRFFRTQSKSKLTPYVFALREQHRQLPG